MIYSLLLLIAVIFLPDYTIARRKLITNENTVPQSYIVTLAEDSFKSEDDDETTQAKISQIIQGHGQVTQVYKYAMQGFTVTLDDVGLQIVLNNHHVISVEENAYIKLEEPIDDPDVISWEQDGIRHLNQETPWNLDRIDDEDLHEDGSYNPDFGNGGAGVTVYVIDTGILDTHEEFEGRAEQKFNCAGGENKDCNGHGTHVAGIIGSKTYGVAKQVKLVGVKVFNCHSNGAVIKSTEAVIIAGIEWVIANAVKPATANLSFATAKHALLNRAVKMLVDSGVPTVVAAGNEGKSACDISPASEPSAITVGATTNLDERNAMVKEGIHGLWGSNLGPCVDILAPGYGIKSTWIGSNNKATYYHSGTSQASPHVCGAVALYLGEDENLCVSAVTSKLLAASIINKVIIYDQQSHNMTFNRMLYVGKNSYASDTYYLKSFHDTYIRPDAGGNVVLSNTRDDWAKISLKYLGGNNMYALQPAADPYGRFLDVPGKGRNKRVASNLYRGPGSVLRSMVFYMNELRDGRVTFKSLAWRNYLKADMRNNIIDTQTFVNTWEKFTLVPTYACD